MSQAEAATVIQKQFRGYQVRKEYKEKLNSDATVYDHATSNMMRYFCHRWKAHSIFQVLLLYRAAKEQDLVYFSQQVHLYNQGIMSAVSNSSMQRLSLVQIREMDRSAARKAFGNRPANVCKIPFRFDTIPYMDTSPMCDPVEAGLDALYADNLTMQPGDFDTWDAPLRRKKSLMRRNKKYKDQEVQTSSGSNFTPNTSVTTDCGSISAHVQTPFRRELLDTSPLIASKGYASKAPMQPAPIPPHKMQGARRDESPRTKQGGNLVQQQSWMDKSNDNRLPVSSKRNEYDYDNNNRSIDFSPEPGSRSGQRRADMGAGRPTSHIRELESRGREVNSGAEDAPFNFQAMLRKTPHNRQSMKRNSIYTTDDADDYSPNSHSSYGAYGGNSYNNSGSSYQMPSVGSKKNQWEQQGNEASGGALRKGPPSYSAAVKGPGAQGQWNDRSQDNWGAEHKDYRGGAAGGKSSALNNKRSSVSFEEEEKRHELVPGFVVEGDVSEL